MNVDHFRAAAEKATIDCPIISLATLDNILEVEYPNKIPKKQCKEKGNLGRSLVSNKHPSHLP